MSTWCVHICRVYCTTQHTLRLFFLFCSFSNFFRCKWRAAWLAPICALNWVPNEIFDEVMDIWKFPSLISLYGDFTRSQICHVKTTFRSKTDPTNKFLNSENGPIVFSSSSSTHRHTSTRSCYNIYSRLWGVSVPTFRIFEDFRGFWLGTCDIYPRCPAKNIWNFPIKIFFLKKSKIGHGGSPRNRIPEKTTVTEFSKTFLVFYKWPNLTNYQGVLPSTVPRVYIPGYSSLVQLSLSREGS